MAYVKIVKHRNYASVPPHYAHAKLGKKININDLCLAICRPDIYSHSYSIPKPTYEYP